jgi:hypothetical protein
MSKYRVVTNGYEFVIQERKYTFWKSRPYWSNLDEGGSAWIEFPIPGFYKTQEAAEKRIKELEKDEARYSGEWKPVRRKSMSGWIGVDLDGTLAQYEGWVGPEHVGKPIPRMVERVKRWLAEGKNVKIMTARANPEGFKGSEDSARAMIAIQQWCKEHLGRVLPITYKKDYAMYELWDDRAVQVIPNTGIRADSFFVDENKVRRDS